MAETQGAKVEFVLSRAGTERIQGLPAFVTLLPTNLWFVQRREYFRISAPLHPPIFVRPKCRTKKRSASALRSVSGRHGRADGYAETGRAGRGMRFTQIELDMGAGGFYFDAQLIAISDAPSWTAKMKLSPRRV
jgi:c-di-GMP-binding flagellar brake protein YcgR